MAINKDKIALLYLPLLCQLTSMFNSVFAKYGIHRLYLYVYIVALGFLFIVSKKKGKTVPAMAIIYLLLLLFVFIIHLVMGSHPPLLLLSGFLTYFLPFLYWIIYCLRDNGYIQQILFFLKYPMGLMAIIAIVQYFFAPDLWGFYNAEEGMMLWAEGLEFVDYSVFFRATSLFGSPQILGLAMAFYLILFLKFLIKKGNFIDYSLVGLYSVAGILSGSKSFFVIVGIYILFVIFMSKSKLVTKIVFAIVVTAAIYILNYYSDTLGFLGRITDSQRIVEGEQAGRLARYSYVLANMSFFGEGPGIAQAISGFTRGMSALESYLFQMLYELGIITIIPFLLCLIGGFIRSNQKIIYGLIVFSMVYVHAFNSFVFFIYWALLLVPNPVAKFLNDNNISNNAC